MAKQTTVFVCSNCGNESGLESAQHATNGIHVMKKKPKQKVLGKRQLKKKQNQCY